MRQEPKVVNCLKEPFDVYIGRGRGSIWGNPYSHKEETLAQFVVGSRKEAVEKFEEYLLSNEELMAKIGELKGKTLGCFCKPKSCHGDILLKYANGSSKLF
jgi:hypothetical protein